MIPEEVQPTVLELDTETLNSPAKKPQNCCLHPCCTHCCCFKCMNEESTCYGRAALCCFRPLSCCSVVSWLLLLILLLNIFGFASTSSAFYGLGNLNTTVIVAVFIAMTLCLFFLYHRATIGTIVKRRNLSPVPLDRSCCYHSCFKLFTALLIYLIPTYPLLTFSRMGLYPGTWLPLGVTLDIPAFNSWNNVSKSYEPSYLEVSESYDIFAGGERFYFTSKYDGEKIRGFKKILGNQSSSLTSPPIPIVVLGGNGGNGWINPSVAEKYTRLKRNTTNVRFDVFSYSYRGYFPNDGLTPSEQALIGDSESIFKHIAELYPGQRPILLSWSLGAAPAAALMKFFSADEIACVGFSMPWSSAHQVVNEMVNYFSMPYIWLIPGWNSVERITHADSAVPTMVLSGGVDRLISPHHQLEMYEASPSNDKELLYSPNMGH